MTDWPFWPGDTTSGTSTYTLNPVNTTTTWYMLPRAVERPRPRRRLALPVAIGHAVFFLALALAGWLR